MMRGFEPHWLHKKYFFSLPDWLNWIERKTSNLEVEGSSPLSGKANLRLATVFTQQFNKIHLIRIKMKTA